MKLRAFALCWMLSCSGEAPAPAPAENPPPAAPPATAGGGKNPPLPAENPIWNWDAGGFVGDVHWYGEADWDDVEMRAAQHLAFAQGDAARRLAAGGQWAEAATTWVALDAELGQIGISAEGPAREIIGLLRQDAVSNAALLGALSRGEAPPAAPEGLRRLRARYLALAQAGDGAGAAALLDELAAWTPPEFDLDAWTDFSARHALRVRLIQAYLDSRDPLAMDDAWGYFTPAAPRRQRALLVRAAAALAQKAPPADTLMGAAPALSGPALAWPSQLGAALVDPSEAPLFTVEELGALVTGDSLIDVAGWPGPKAIGSLERLGLDDVQWRERLEAEAAQLNAALASDPVKVVSRLRALIAEVDAMGHGSRFYSIKALRNAGVRQLARAGRLDLARQLWADTLPLHNQDWAAPNRAGVVSLIAARLETPGAAEAALQATRDFLARCAAAEAGTLATDFPEDAARRPPSMGGPGGGPPPQNAGPGRSRPAPPPQRGNPPAPR